MLDTRLWPSVMAPADELDRLFRRFFDDRMFRPAATFPRVNVRETEDKVLISASLPGVKAEALDLRVEGETLTISGERTPTQVEDGRMIRRERLGGKFQREIQLPSRVVTDGVDARLENGLLVVAMDKAPEARPQMIQVKST